MDAFTCNQYNFVNSRNVYRYYSAVVIFTPLFLPLCQTFGIDLVHFGLVMAVNLTIGMCTPPLGVCLFVAGSTAKMSLKDQMKDLLPMLTVLIFILMLITYIPDLVLILPNLFIK
ncbi:TRAP transporter large permease subunit [Criibacterium bergeronii]|uniref:TRAP transporter large permease subunit n=1 Tax=Criibacterium bergeronii TaxID=1871336 RepID=UPI001FAB2CE3|nr:TRAP transporter large permease subunit [Criibacterium bergeronii]